MAEVPVPEACRPLGPAETIVLAFDGASLVDVAEAIARLRCVSFTFTRAPAAPVDVPTRKMKVGSAIDLLIELARAQGLEVSTVGEGCYRVD